MRFLFVTPNSIERSAGGSIRTSHIRDALCRLGEVHTVVVQGGIEEHRDQHWQTGWIRKATYTRRGFSPEALRQRARLRRWLAGLLAEHHYDLVVVCFLSTAYLLPKAAWKRVVADADDAFKSAPPDGSTSWQRRIALVVRNKLTVRVARQVAHVWYVNPLDGPRLPATRKSLLRNVVTLPFAGRPRGAAVPGRILMVGLMAHAPNAHGLRWFVTEVLPALKDAFPQAELHVIGKYEAGFDTEFAGRHVKVRGFVADLAAEYDQAALVVAPIFFGGGTQIKVIDALAHARPLVASSFAHSGFAADLRAGEHLLVANDRQQWIAECTRLLQEPEAAAAMAARGQAAAAAYGPDGLHATVKDTIARCMAQ